MTREKLITEAQLIAEIDARTDRMRRSTLASAANALMAIAFIALPALPGANPLLGNFQTHHALMLSGPLLLCLSVGAILYRLVGPRHRAYRALDAVELGICVAFPALLPVIESRTAPVAAVGVLLSSAFWGQGKPGRARLYGMLIALVGLVPTGIFLARGRAEQATFAATVGLASILMYLICVRSRIVGVRAELRRNHLRENARILRVAHERDLIEKQLSAHVFSQLEVLASQLAHAGLPEAATARRLSEMVSELVLPASKPVEFLDLAALLQSRCRALCPGIRLQFSAPGEPHTQVGARPARAVLRIAQELVRNSVVHSGARTIEVVMEANLERLHLGVSDDGAGLTEPAVERATGGLLNARSWAGACGGSLQLTSRSGFQTSISVTVNRHQQA